MSSKAAHTIMAFTNIQTKTNSNYTVITVSALRSTPHCSLHDRRKLASQSAKTLLAKLTISVIKSNLPGDSASSS